MKHLANKARGECTIHDLTRAHNFEITSTEEWTTYSTLCRTSHSIARLRAAGPPSTWCIHIHSYTLGPFNYYMNKLYALGYTIYYKSAIVHESAGSPAAQHSSISRTEVG